MADTDRISSQLPAPLVSVVLPAWNAAHTLGAALQTALPTVLNALRRGRGADWSVEQGSAPRG